MFRKNMSKLFLFTLLFIGLFSNGIYAAINCPSGVLSSTKGNKLYLYFANSSDTTFPDYSDYGAKTSPLDPFNVADLDSGIGTTQQLRDRIFEIVTDDYCEFNVKVEQTTSKPSPSESRWEIVGLGTDDEPDSGQDLFGEAQNVDTNDAHPKDYARVWAGSFKTVYSGAGGALNGANSTLERWASAIGETSAHEAAHNYGAGHNHSAPRPGSSEDEQNNHIMATGSTGLTGEMRASRDRHFSDTEYEILGHNIGLNTYTLHNWDFINPNDTAAHGARLKILSNESSLSIAWWYNGSTSPWQNPTITNTGTTQSFQGVNYNVFNLDFTNAKSWSGPTAGVVDPGDEFHIGASFTSSNPVIVSKVELLNNGGSPLSLSPRLPSYDIGTADLASGDFAISFFNPNPHLGGLVIQNLQVNSLPRMMDINAMVRNARPMDIRGLPIPLTATRSTIGAAASERGINLIGNSVKVSIAKLSDKRSVDIVYGPKDCPPGSIGSGTNPQRRAVGAGDSDKGEVIYCQKGNALSLFPATYTYITATVVQPNAKYWDKAQNKFVIGDLVSRLFYQVGGIVPDFNKNGADDLIDIRTGVSNDTNNNGVPDEVDPSIIIDDHDQLSLWQWLLLILAILLLLILLRPKH